MKPLSRSQKQSEPAPADGHSMLIAVGRRIPLWVVILASGVGYWVLYAWFPLLPNVDRVPAADIRTFLPAYRQGLLYGLLIVTLYGLYVLAFWKVWAGSERDRQANDGRHRAGPRESLAVVLLIAAMLAAPLLLTYSVNSTDLFRYVISGRITSVYESSPFEMTRDSFASDPYLPLAGEWASETTPYGPAWEGIAAAVTTVAGGELATSIILFKLVGLLAHIGCAALIWGLLSSLAPERRTAFTILWAWNPALLLTFVMGAHNDSLMLFWLLLGLLFLQRKAYVTGVWVMALAVLTKPVAALALPFFLVAVLRDLPDWPSRLRYLLLAGGGALAIGWLSFLPWSGPDSVLFTPLRLGLRLVQEATAFAGFSVAVAGWFRLEAAGVDVPLDTLGLIARAVFLLFLAWLLWQCWRGRSALWAAANVFLGYLYQALSFRIWYATWPFPFLLLDAARPEATDRQAYRLHVGLWFLLLSQISVVVYGHVRVWQYDGLQPPAHYLGVTLVFVLPWLLAWVSRMVVAELVARPSTRQRRYGRGRDQLPSSR